MCVCVIVLHLCKILCYESWPRSSCVPVSIGVDLGQRKNSLHTNLFIPEFICVLKVCKIIKRLFDSDNCSPAVLQMYIIAQGNLWHQKKTLACSPPEGSFKGGNLQQRLFCFTLHNLDSLQLPQCLSAQPLQAWRHPRYAEFSYPLLSL